MKIWEQQVHYNLNQFCVTSGRSYKNINMEVSTSGMYTTETTVKLNEYVN